MLKAFASFGFCKAHAAAFALPTYQSAWLKTHHPAAFLAGVLTHDPGMYPKRLILDDARTLGIAVLGLDVNVSTGAYTVERLDPPPEPHPEQGDRHPDLPDGSAYGIRLSLADVKGISEAEIARIVAGRPYPDLADFWRRAHVSRPVVERLVLAGAFDTVYGIGSLTPRQPHRTVASTGEARSPASSGRGGGARSPGATSCSTSPSSTGGPGRAPVAGGAEGAGRGWRRPVRRAPSSRVRSSRARSSRARSSRARSSRVRSSRTPTSPGSRPVSPGPPVRCARPTSTRPSSSSTSVTHPGSSAARVCPR